MRAIGSYEEALKVFSEDSDPLMWSRIQTFLGTIYAAHSESIAFADQIAQPHETSFAERMGARYSRCP